MKDPMEMPVGGQVLWSPQSILVQVVMKNHETGELMPGTLVDWKDEPGRGLELSYSMRRQVTPIYEAGSDSAMGMKDDGPIYFEMKATKNGPPTIHWAKKDSE